MLLSVVLCASTALAQVGPATSPGGQDNSGRRTVTAVRLADGESIALDGRLDEPFWSRAVPAADFMQIDPANGTPATERTEVRIVFNRDALYLGVTCFDSEPDRWFGWQLRRDERLFSDDGFMWTIDTFLDGRTGYFFEMNPSGLMADSLMGPSGDNREWDGIWNARARRSEIGWTLEIEIPFRTLNFNPDNDTWGINFQRVVRRKNEESIWMGWARNQGLRRMTNAGLLAGIREVTQGHGLDIKPYGLVSSLASPGRGTPAMTTDASAGLDLFYNPTPLLRANFTVNTDFAQTEVDQRQVNLTRYSLFFPEQRDFFLDGATFFDFASDSGGGGTMFGPVERGNEERLIPFFSRRIGLSAEGTPQTIDFGTKVTGQAGAQDVGLLHVRTGEDAGFGSEDFTVARVKRRVLRQSSVGGLYTRRDPRLAGAGATHMVGLDARLATSTFLRDQNLEGSGWVLYNSQPGSPGGRGALGASLLYPNDLWNARIDAAEIQEHFDSAIGFVSRRAYRQYSQAVEFGPRPANHPTIRQVMVGGRVDTLTDLNNGLLKRNIVVQPAQVQFHSQDNFRLTFFRRYERLDTPFPIARGITLPVGAAYTFHRYRLFVSTANRRRLAVNSSIEVGEFYSGRRAEQAAAVSVRVRPGLFFAAAGQWNHVTLPEGRFTTRLYRIVGETQLSPFIAFTNTIQYDSQSSVLGWQSRFRWIVTPGSDLYVVYTHNWRDDPLLDRFSTLDNRLASKILYTYRF
ncbi:MAG: carbohydrate binding family 9 domain-containing protein [Acidobacteria bacterium]|nr:carbohydrate binding family 9 domain-containing protein [Acidobacteriota bacterium]